MRKRLEHFWNEYGWPVLFVTMLGVYLAYLFFAQLAEHGW